MANDQQTFKKMSAIPPGTKITLWGFSDMGFPYVFQARLISATVAPYAQHPLALFLSFKAKGKRRERSIVLHGIASWIVWRGWHDVDTEMYREHKNAGPAIVSKSWGCFSDKYRCAALGSVARRPFAMGEAGLDTEAVRAAHHV